MTFIKISKEHLPFLTQPRSLDFADCWKESQYISSFDGGRFIGYILADGDIMKGFITLTVGEEEADIEDVYVLKEYRREGIAKALIEKALCEIKVSKFFLEVRESNIPAINLYKSFGFNQISVRKKYYSDGENALVFLKEI